MSAPERAAGQLLVRGAGRSHNHAFYVAAGAGTVQIEQNTFDMKSGTVIKVPEGKQHSVTNTGTEDLVFLTIYDPPNVDGTP
ncbi:cupin domain-containing protein [Nocardia sp. NPDC049190]|uniref:cupin domain-containing protein n=1 Tax=Nocardia sp. NPDC049190 TaxID=3155650 RepID=UPI0033FE489B